MYKGHPHQRNRSWIPASWLVGALAGGLVTAAGSTVRAQTDDIPAKIAAAKDSYDGANHVVVFENTDVTVADSGIGTNTHTRVVKVLSDAGIPGQSVRRWGFDPATKTVRLKEIRIHRADGTIEPVDVAAAVVQPAPAGIIFWGTVQLSIAVPGLEVGDAVEVTHIEKGFNIAYLAGGENDSGPTRSGSDSQSSITASLPDRFLTGAALISNPQSPTPDPGSLQPPMPGHWYEVVNWQESVPILEKRYTVRIPKNKPLQFEIVNGELNTSVRFDGDTAVYTFAKKDIPPFKSQPRMVSRRDVACKLVLATVEDWHAKARWFYEANEPSFKLNDEIREKVREIVAGCDSNEDKIACLNHWVAENIRYVGTSRGACEGYTTHPAIETFRDRGGVCKDKAGMLVTMLRAAGFESYIVMTMAGARVEKTPADQFNHAVTCVKRPDGSLRLLDPTWLPKNREMWSSAEQHQAVVFGTPDGAMGLQLSPHSPSEENVTSWRVESTLLPTGELRGSFSVSTLGCPETNLRRAVSRFRPEDRPGRFEESLRKLAPNARLTSLDVTDPVDFSGPATVQLACAVPDYALGGGQRRYFRLPALTGVLADMVLPDIRDSAPTAVKERRYPAKIRSTRRFTCQETIHLPSGWTPEHLPESCDIDGPAGAIVFDIETTPGVIEYRLTVDLKKHVIPVEEYENYKSVIDKLLDLGKDRVVCREEEKSV